MGAEWTDGVVCKVVGSAVARGQLLHHSFAVKLCEERNCRVAEADLTHVLGRRLHSR